MIGCDEKECGEECGQMGNSGPMGHCDVNGRCQYRNYALGCEEVSNGEFIQP